MRNLWNYLRAPFFSPKGFALRGALIIAVFVLFQLLGLKESTCVICGTSPSGDPSDQVAILLGMGYAIMHFASFMLAPIFFLGALLMLIVLRLFPYSPGSGETSPEN